MYELELLNQIIYSPFTIERLFMAVCCSLGIWVDMKLLWVLIYQIKYGGDAGENYLRYGKKLAP